MAGIPNSPQVERLRWVDVCKGLCIVLVVYGHISGGVGAAGKLPPDSIWIQIREWVYLFHMPAFFALSGLFAPRSSLSAGDFLWGRLRTIVYPYVVWTAIFVVVQLLMVRYVNNPLDRSQALRFLLAPIGYGLWFLYSLLIISVLFYGLGRLRIPAAGMLVLAIVLSWLASRNTFGFWPILNTSMGVFVYYAAAASLRGKILPLMNQTGWLWSLVLGLGGWLVLTALHSIIREGGWFPSFALACLGTCSVAFLAKAISESRLWQFWAWLGFYSLEIYLGHPLWGTLSRVVLHLLRAETPATLVIGGLFLGLAGSLAVGFLCRKWSFPYLFRWPAKKSNVPGPGTATT